VSEIRVTAPSDHPGFGKTVRLEVSIDNSRSELAVKSISYELNEITKLTDSAGKVLNFRSTNLTNTKEIPIPAKQVEAGKTEIFV
jgi:hypothetical protein